MIDLTFLGDMSTMTFSSLMTVNALEHGWIDPHSVLGLHAHPTMPEYKVIRLWRPGAKEVFIEWKGSPHQLECIDPKGLFELIVPNSVEPADYKVWHISGLLDRDPYTFWPTFG